MPKSIQLTPGPKAQPAVAPAAAPPPSTSSLKLTGLPLPAGQIFEAPSHLTELERSQLKAVGWDGGQITPQMIAAAQAMNEDARAMPPIPMDPATPPVEFQVQDISELPADEQAKHRQNIAAAIQAERAKPAAAPAAATAPIAPKPKPIGVGQVQAAPPPLHPIAQKVEQSKQLNVDYGEPARPATRAVPTAEAVNPKAAPSLQSQAEAVRTEEPIAPQEDCPHCGWHLATPDIPEPPYEEKMGFMSTQVLGEGKPFLKVFSLLGGNLKLTFRTLTTREVDACYRQANLDRQSGEVESDPDWIEKVNRYRLYLQLQRAQSDRFDHDQPDGLSKLTNPHAEAFWEFPDNETVPELRQIENYMLKVVLATETMARIAQQCCGQFNRLVSKLEAQVSNDPFWKATGVQS